MGKGGKVGTKRVGGSSDNASRAKAPSDNFKRDKATINRLNMYRGGKPVRTKDGKITGGEFMAQDKAGGKTVDAATGRIAPDRRWFGNTRVVSATQLDRFREVMAAKAADPYSVVLHSKALPLGLLVDTKVQRRAHLLSAESFKDTFGKVAQRKRPRLAATDVGELVAGAVAAAAGGGRTGAGEDGSLVVGGGGGGEKLAVASGSELGVLGEDGGGPVGGGTVDKFGARDSALSKGTSKRIWAELYRVLDCSDVVIQVLDARDPEGTRSHAIEAHLKANAKHKTLIFVLNKVDLVPTWVTRRWVAALSAVAPTLAFTANNMKKPFGKGGLIAILRQLARLHAEKKAISVGFIGYPNVGKSSIINALKGTKACNVAPIPGETKVWQYVTLMKRVYLIDCPGTVHLDASKFGTGGGTARGGTGALGGGAESSAGGAASLSKLNADAELVLKGVVRAEKLAAPELYVAAILARVLPAHVTATYGVAAWADASDFLEKVARKQGRLLQGGEPNIEMVAINVVNDWQRGKLPYFTPPPAVPRSLPPTSATALVGDSAATTATAMNLDVPTAAQAVEGLEARLHPLIAGVADPDGEQVGGGVGGGGGAAGGGKRSRMAVGGGAEGGVQEGRVVGGGGGRPPKRPRTGGAAVTGTGDTAAASEASAGGVVNVETGPGATTTTAIAAELVTTQKRAKTSGKVAARERAKALLAASAAVGAAKPADDDFDNLEL